MKKFRLDSRSKITGCEREYSNHFCARNSNPLLASPSTVRSFSQFLTHIKLVHTPATVFYPRQKCYHNFLRGSLVVVIV